MTRGVPIVIACVAVSCAPYRAPSQAPQTPGSTAPAQTPPREEEGGAPTTLGGPTNAPTGAPQQPPKLPPAKPPQPIQSPIAQAEIDFDRAQQSFAAASTDCVQMCKALQSMENATEHLCALVQGTTDVSRCTDARKKVDAARAKVKASCGAC